MGRGPKRYLVALGYAGWAPGQLEGEMKAGGWIAVPADAALAFDEDAENEVGARDGPTAGRAVEISCAMPKTPQAGALK